MKAIRSEDVPALFPKVKNFAATSIGFTVAESPTRVNLSPHIADSRSSESTRCVPRLFPAIAWISSTITVRVVFSIFRPDSEPSST